ncbi:MAG TPA: hypothetical protein VMP11_13015 [Verrucomicrobiae bacterium]|nr:hypothetical protein [Verrucomicrobiae bacterium]
MNGGVNPNGLATSAYFQWGPTTSYGNTTASMNVGSGNSTTNISTTIAGLSQSTTYHYRLVASNSAGTNTGGDETFAATATGPILVLNSRALNVSTLAGQAGSAGSANGTGSSARFDYPTGVALDTQGNLYVADGANQTIRKIAPGEVVTTLAGLAGASGTNDGTGSNARFYYPTAVALDSAANVYVADSGNDTIRKITPSGVVTTLAGQAGSQGSADGTGSNARFFEPNGVAVDSSGNVYVADTGNDTIRKITPSGVVTTLAGQAGSQGSADGAGSSARFFYPYGVSVDLAGNVYVTDTYNDTIRKITPNAVVTTLAGLAGSSGYIDGTGDNARFNNPEGAASIDTAGNVYVSDFGNDTIRMISPGGVVTTLAGSPEIPGSTDGTGTAATFNGPAGVAVDSTGNVYVADSQNDTIREGTPNVPFNSAAPQAFTGYATSVTSNSATLVGSVGPCALITTVYFAWGTTTSYGADAGIQSVGSYSYPVGVDGNLISLSPGTTYHFSVVASNACGVSFGDDGSFTTTAPLITPNGTLSSAISVFDSDSRSALNDISILAEQSGVLGDYFQSLAPGNTADFVYDLSSFTAGVVAQAYGVPDEPTLQDNVVDALQTFFPSLMDVGWGQIAAFKRSTQGNSCSGANMFDSGWQTQMQAGNWLSLAPSVIEHDDTVMAALWLGQPIETLNNNGSVSSALDDIRGNSTALSSLGTTFGTCTIPSLTSNLQAQTATLLGGIPSMSTQEQTAWANDLTARSQVPLIYNEVIWANFEFLSQVQYLNEHSATSQLIAEALTFGADCFSDGAAGIILGPVDLEADVARLTYFETQYQSAFSVMEQSIDAGSAIWMNEVGAFSEISSQALPQTVTAQIGSIGNYSIGYIGGALSDLTGSSSELSSYTAITLTNTSSDSAEFVAIAQYSHTEFVLGLGWLFSAPLVVISTNVSIAPGQSGTLSAYYKQNGNGASPDAGSSVTINVLGYNASGAFFISAVSTNWPSNWLPSTYSESGLTESLRSQGLAILQDSGSGTSTNSVAAIENPVVAYNTYIFSNQTYGMQIQVSNPFNLPVTAAITQSVPPNDTILSTDGTTNTSFITWTSTLMPFTRITGSLTFSDPAPLGSSFTLPAAAVTLLDPVSGDTLDAQGSTPQFTVMSPIQVIGGIPFSVSGIGSSLQITITNLTETSQSGSATISLTDTNGALDYSATQSLSVAPSAASVLAFTLPSTLLPGWYSLGLVFNDGGGSASVLVGTFQELTQLEPQITNVVFSGSSGSYTVTVTGVGFGDLQGDFPFKGDTSYFRMADNAQIGHAEWGYSGDGNTLTYQFWSDTQIQVSGFGGQPGDAVAVALWNPTSGAGATWGGNVPGGSGTPQITSVTFSGSGSNLQIYIVGSGFGSAPTNMPFTGDLNYFSFNDFRTHCAGGSSLFGAGFAGWGVGSASSVTLNYQSWSNNEIVINGIGGSYGQGCASLQNGDPVIIGVWSTSDTGFTGQQTAWGGFALLCATSCNYVVSQTNMVFALAGGSSNVAVTANGSNCAWTAVSDSGFITVTSGNGGYGNGMLTYTVGYNSNTTARSGTLSIAGQTVTVTQSSGDSVGDGIPNWWRAAYFPNQPAGNQTGTMTNNMSCAACDADGTGQNNLFKYVSGLNPTNPASVFLLNIVPTNQLSQYSLFFAPLALGRTYTPEFTTNLASRIWFPLTTYIGPLTNGSQITVTDTNASWPQEFYRIEISLP